MLDIQPAYLSCLGCTVEWEECILVVLTRDVVDSIQFAAEVTVKD